MKRLALTTAALLALLAVPGGAHAAQTGGNNPATLKLERSFTTALTARIDSSNGCYPSEATMAKKISKRWKFKVAVVKNLKAVRTRGLVYVIRSASNCNNVRFALRKGALYELDAARGEIVVLGKAAARQRRLAAARANRGPLRAVSIATKTFNVGKKHRRLRFENNCPGGKLPLGGGMIATPPVGAGGEGVYPHSYERLGAQRGWHITGWLFDGGDGSAAPHQIQIQAVCGLGLSPMSAPHSTVFVKPGETKSATARCPGGQKLMSGGFQRTDFLEDGGDYITESRAIGANSWRVRARAYGDFGGELTAIAYCVKSAQPLLTEVQGSAPIALGASASATTTTCPPGKVLTSGGFTTEGADQTFFAGGSINGDNTWTAHGYGFFGPATNLTAFGYCLQPGV